MHIADPTIGIFGANGIVAAGLPIAVGAATAAQLRADHGVVVAFFGDGAVAQGAFHEAVNLAAVWELPVIFFCENNGYAEFSAAADQHAATLKRRAKGYRIDYVAVDGNDAVATASVMSPVVDSGARRRRTGHRRGHHLPVARPLRRRPRALPDRPTRSGVGRARPAARARATLRAAGITDDAIARARVVGRAGARRRGRSAPGSSTRPRPPRCPTSSPARGRRAPSRLAPPTTRRSSAPWTRSGRPSNVELTDDERVFVAGIDVGAGGNVFGLTRGLHDRFGDRVRDTPISETAIMGLGVGAAMAGMRPVVELMYLDFVGVCLDQLLNQAAKLPFMTGGAAEMSLTVRTQFGAGRSSGSQHSQSLEALLAHIPGLTVVMPSTPADTYGLLRAAIQDPNPVVFIENRLLYGMKGPQPPARPRASRSAGRRSCARAPTSRVVSVSRMVHEALAAADASPPKASRSR